MEATSNTSAAIFSAVWFIFVLDIICFRVSVLRVKITLDTKTVKQSIFSKNLYKNSLFFSSYHVDLWYCVNAGNVQTHPHSDRTICGMKKMWNKKERQSNMLHVHGFQQISFWWWMSIHNYSWQNKHYHSPRNLHRMLEIRKGNQKK